MYEIRVREHELDPVAKDKLNGDHQHNKSQIRDFKEEDYVHKTGNESVGGDKTFSNNVTIQGNLTVNGTTTTTGSSNLNVSNNEITLNDGETGEGVSRGQALIRIDRGIAPDAVIKYDETDKKFKVGFEGGELTDVTQIYHVGSTPPTNKNLIWVKI